MAMLIGSLENSKANTLNKNNFERSLKGDSANFYFLQLKLQSSSIVDNVKGVPKNGDIFFD